MIAAVCALLSVLTTVRLPVEPGAQETYFLPLGELGADSSTFTLKTVAGADVPFSFDARIDYPEDGQYRPPADGRRSTESAPSAEDRYRRLGWLSFRAPEGADELAFSFRTGAAKTAERPNPSVRTWWVELVREPPKFGETGVALKAGKAIVMGPSAFADLAAIGGRRVVTYWRTVAADGKADGHLGLRLPNKAGYQNLLSVYFAARSEETDSIADGIVKDGATAFSHPSRALELLVQQPVRVLDLKVQSAPRARPDGLHLQSDLFYAGDTVRISLLSGHGEILVDFTDGEVRGQRVVTVPDGATLRTVSCLRDAGGHKLRVGEGRTFPLKGIAAGRYSLQVLTLLGQKKLSSVSFPIKVEKGPKW